MTSEEKQGTRRCEACQAPLPKNSNLPLCDDCFTASCDSCCADDSD
ncbi:hypothetical protein [Pelagicoccus sp. SDUM812005]|nr:hypothetical protein [Pelagicoccus sp. SDUM812005]MDQ8182508.1 hypothetical protein [Pelagicoccus sp. SDUM812005]